MSPYGLAQSLSRSNKYAKDFIDSYFKNFPKLKKYLDQVKEEVKKKGYTQTMMGRRRQFPLSSGRLSRQMERAAINTPIQGSAADIMKKAMVDIAKRIELAKSLEDDKPRLLLQVHDELIFELTKKQIAEFSWQIKGIMEDVIELSVPLEVDVKKGKRWGKLESAFKD